jgi:DNA-binding transcriptional MerR regulator
VLRFWETEFPTLRPSKSKSNQRRYSRKDVELVLRIRDLLYEDGFTIEGARRRMRRGAKDEEPEVPARTRAVLSRVREEVEELLQLIEE